ncbi:hypothetical protein, partial [Salmonella enterica]|uniref:hypothetical protein n=1 Tax=Salmonella enterica TaxID=28901 RepID=UPI0019E307F0
MSTQIYCAVLRHFMMMAASSQHSLFVLKQLYHAEISSKAHLAGLSVSEAEALLALPSTSWRKRDDVIHGLNIRLK